MHACIVYIFMHMLHVHVCLHNKHMAGSFKYIVSTVTLKLITWNTITECFLTFFHSSSLKKRQQNKMSNIIILNYLKEKLKAVNRYWSLILFTFNGSLKYCKKWIEEKGGTWKYWYKLKKKKTCKKRLRDFKAWKNVIRAFYV